MLEIIIKSESCIARFDHNQFRKFERFGFESQSLNLHCGLMIIIRYSDYLYKYTQYLHSKHFASLNIECEKSANQDGLIIEHCTSLVRAPMECSFSMECNED